MRSKLQAIVFAAGPGSRMLTMKFQPKALLPVGNYPLIYFPLRSLQKAGFREATIIIPSGCEREFQKVLDALGLNMVLDFASVDTSDDPGTADSLRAIKGKIKKNVDDIILISSDLITDCDLQEVIDKHQTRGSALTSVLSNLEEAFLKSVAPGPKSKTVVSYDIFCLDPMTNRLLYAVSGGDYEEKVQIPKRIMASVDGEVELSTQYLDAHLYLVKRWVIDYILQKNHSCNFMSSLKAEIVPHILKQQFVTGQSSEQNSIHSFYKPSRYEDLTRKYNTSMVESHFQNNATIDERICHAHIHSGFCARVNTMGAFWQINKCVLTLFEAIEHPLNVKDLSATIHERAQLSSDTLIGKGTELSEKTNAKSCVIGNHCRIEPLVRVANSVLMDHVAIVRGCTIENSLICCSIEKKCTIKNSIVIDKHKIYEGGIYENEILEPSKDYTE